jgi:hypothetical protein
MAKNAPFAKHQSDNFQKKLSKPNNFAVCGSVKTALQCDRSNLRPQTSPILCPKYSLRKPVPVAVTHTGDLERACRIFWNWAENQADFIILNLTFLTHLAKLSRKISPK